MGWIGQQGIEEVNSFADIKQLIAGWDGIEPEPEPWNAARIALEGRARDAVEQSRARAELITAHERKQQREAARLPVIEELGRFLICFPLDTDDLNGKFHRLASEATPTAERLKSDYKRLEGYPEWVAGYLAELQSFRNDLPQQQIKTRLTGRELDAALADPRW